MKINMKDLLYCSVYLIPFFCFSQEFETRKTSVKDIDLKIEEGTYESDTSFSVDKLVLTNSDTNIIAFNENEWSQIKAKIAENRKRIAESKQIFKSNKIDTIYVKIPTKSSQTRISSW